MAHVFLSEFCYRILQNFGTLCPNSVVKADRRAPWLELSVWYPHLALREIIKTGAKKKMVLPDTWLAFGGSSAK